ncbi:MAG: XrtB/PEP-CTERM-associated polysaccharide biosynthesis outer membrane protein EpsL, partial [Gammaproteobacteria bacterium]
PATVFATNFSDRENEFKFDWAPTGRTTLQARLSYFQRSNAGLAARDYSGIIGDANATYALSAKTSIAAGMARNLLSYQTDTDSYFVQNSVYVGSTWKATEKTAFKLRAQHFWLNFAGPLSGFAPDNRQDQVTQSSMSVEWQPVRALKLVGALLHDVRSSNVLGNDYTSNGISVTAVANF